MSIKILRMGASLVYEEAYQRVKTFISIKMLPFRSISSDHHDPVLISDSREVFVHFLYLLRREFPLVVVP